MPETDDDDDDDEMNYIYPGDIYFSNYTDENYECFMWAFHKLSSHNHLNVLEIVRYFVCAYRSDEYISLCDMNIIKPKSAYARRIYGNALNFVDVETVRWLIENDYVSKDIITMKSIADCLKHDLDAYRCYELERRSNYEIEQDSLDLSMYLFDCIKYITPLYEEPNKSIVNEFVVRMYCGDAEHVEYAQTVEFDDIIIDGELFYMLLDHKRVDELLDVATSGEENLNVVDLSACITDDRVDLVKFIFAHTSITVTRIRLNDRYIFKMMCDKKAMKIAQFFRKQGMEWYDITADRSNHRVQWFESVTCYAFN
jgi:hypothetical protein